MNPRPFLNHTLEDLRKLNTRHLLALFRRSRGLLHKCDCPYHCGAEPFESEEENRQLAELNLRVKLVLNEREHVPSSAESRARTVRRGGRAEKKQLRY